VRRRVDVDPANPAVPVSRRVLNELFAHALEVLPEECCGLVFGDDDRRFRRVVRCRNDMTKRHGEDPMGFPRDGREAYYMNAGDCLAALEQAEKTGERVTAIYHSHVGSGAYLSEKDLEFSEDDRFPFADADQIVVSVFDGKVGSLGLFQRDEKSGSYSGHGVDWAEP